MRNSNQILHGDQSISEKNYKVDTAPALAKILLTGMLTRDLFAVANLLVLMFFCD